MCSSDLAVRRGREGLRDCLSRVGAEAKRQDDEIGYGVMRGGEVSGEHTVYFFDEAERIEVTHRATSPDIFATGAIRAGRWLVGQKAGLYGMADVLGLSSGI